LNAVKSLTDYSTVIFDCDGVLLDSNRIKTEAFRTVALEAGETAADKLVDHHRRYGGVARNEKFRYFVEQILALPPDSTMVDHLVALYAKEVRHRLLDCAVAPGLQGLREATQGVRWAVVSGGAQAELREVFTKRGLAPLFDAGIHGSPDNKHTLLARLREAGALDGPAVFLGDSRYDHEAAIRAGLDFVFISGWTEFDDWSEYCASHKLTAVPDLSALLETTTR
jgi:phosphoglycolate phosphatase-like HAD superfamily hydrolase